jgi:hypothetical protein
MSNEVIVESQRIYEPENTFDWFSKKHLRLGVDQIELDVHSVLMVKSW